MARHFDIRKAVVPADGHELKLLILLPKGNQQPPEKTPGILWIHGGGYAVGMAGMVLMSRAKRLATAYGAVVVSPEYRLAGKAPYPAALEDCYAALLYLKAHAEELGCAADRIMVGGESAGGGLTAALCMLARDRGEVNIAFQMPLYPMLDHRDTDSSRNNHGISWNTRRNHAAWRLYLREVEGEIPPYASPARQTDYSNLPPAYTFVGNREPFYCETMTYIENLRKAGVPARVDVYPTGFHAFDMLLPFRRISRQAIEAFEKQYVYAAEHDRAAQSNEE
ncbi:MAG: alpha/beta hydrolase [Clostridia bacterium]|nr:alpha/beta hydrolase [Clostridia bacterium]